MIKILFSGIAAFVLLAAPIKGEKNSDGGFSRQIPAEQFHGACKSDGDCYQGDSCGGSPMEGIEGACIAH